MQSTLFQNAVKTPAFTLPETGTPAAMSFTVARLEVPSTPSTLPDDPGATFSSSSNDVDPNGQQNRTGTVANTIGRKKAAGHFAMVIAPNEIAEPMTNRDKFVGGMKDSFSLFAITGWVFSAGWTQLTNGSPNYGTDAGAFGERLGAAAIRSSSESVFSECLFAPIFHEDPRYYVMGRGNNFFKRAIYAATRVVITKSDSGREVPNFALIAGNAGGAALTIPYYPKKNTTFPEVAETFGGSLGGSAVGYLVTEFLGDALVYAHLKKADY